jgi:membrane protein implicated in regulation of membrane protease activity
MIWKREPALILGVVQAIIALALAFGFNLSTEQVGAILAVTAAVLAVITRSQVTPVERPADPTEQTPSDWTGQA